MNMQLKKYQQETLDTLAEFLTEAKLIGSAAAFMNKRNAPSYPAEYFPLPKLEDAPYICLRIPTGGGKTLLGACSIKLAAKNFLHEEYPLVLWLVPTDVIRQQTLKNLRNPNGYYWKVLDAAFHGAIRIFDVTEFRQLRPQDLRQSLNIFVATFQSFRVTNKEGRKVYQPNEFLEPCFRDISKQDYFEVGENGAYNSFGNLIAYLRPLMIIDEAHNYSSPLSLEIMQKLRPSAVIELTATPAQNNSNVLVQVSASELQAASMIKLPVQLMESQSWEMAIDSAVQRRTALEALAAREAEYIRPIALFQAENKDREITVDVVKKYLIEGAKVPENQIAIATGDRRELDGVNLSARDCPIRYVITVQALKEGWDCPFAYVFCSLAKVHSPKDAEQLLGRVLRMPYATSRNAPELNKAYAFVAVKEWEEAVAQIRDNLLGMGFEDAEARRAVQPTLIDLTTSIVIRTEERPQLDNLNLKLQGAAIVDKTPEGYELRLENMTTEDCAELVANTNKIYKDKGNRDKLLEAIHGGNFQPTQDNSPATRGVKFEMPMLCLDFGYGATLAEREQFLPLDWKLTGNYDTDLPNFRKDVSAQIYEFDVAGHKVTEKYLGDNTENLFRGRTNWTLNELIGWFTREILTTDIIYEDLAEFIRRILCRLSEEQDLSLDELVRLRFTLRKLLAEKVETCRASAYKAGWQQTLFGDDSVACVRSDITKTFKPDDYPAKSFYNGRAQFQKHFYPIIGNMNGEEVRCAQLIDANENVATWIRNVEREPLYSFWLPTHDDKFYPDFVIKLTDGTYAAIEYKGGHLADSSDTQEKKMLGELWERLNGGKFLMATLRDDAGRDLATQLREFFGGDNLANA